VLCKFMWSQSENNDSKSWHTKNISKFHVSGFLFTFFFFLAFAANILTKLDNELLPFAKEWCIKIDKISLIRVREGEREAERERNCRR